MSEQSQTTGSVSFRLPQKLFNQLHHHARQNDLTASQIIRRLLSSYEPVANSPAEPLPEKKRWLVGSK